MGGKLYTGHDLAELWVAYPRPRVVIVYRGLQESRTCREDE